MQKKNQDEEVNILQLGKFYFPHRGGIETVVQLLSEGLVLAGHQVTVICASESKTGKSYEHNGVKIEKAPCYGTFSGQPILPSYSKILGIYLNSCDIVHLHSPHPMVELLCMMRVKDQPVVLTYHSDIVRQKILGRFYRPILQRVLEFVDYILIPSPQLLEYSLILKKFASKCRLIPFGYPVNSFDLIDQIRVKKEELCKKYGRYLLFVGRLVEYKGVGYLVEAMKRVDANLVIIGSGPQEKFLKTKCAHLGLANKVFFLGDIEDSELKAYYHGCEIFVLPSITPNEALGMVQLEAMACGKPLITTDLESGVKFANQNGETGIIVPPKNSLALIDSLNKLLTDESLKVLMGKKSRKRFLDYFTRDKMIADTLKVYKSCLGVNF